MRTIILTHTAAKDLDALPGEARETVLKGLIRYTIFEEGEVKQLSGRDGYRLRVGRFRVIFDEDAATILAIYIGKRETTTYRRN